MNIQLFKSENRKTINWASGTSTEIFIYPPGSNFAERNFFFRISTATVEAEESNFTFFEDITRHLMILKGELELIHEDRYTKHLKVFDQDTFSGEWKTRSKGKVTDFNLMLKGGAKGSLTHHKIEAGNTANFKAKNSFYFLYLVSGSLHLEDELTINAGDLISTDKEKIVTTASEPCDLIEINVEGVQISTG
jgi:environmental stress-induced protein Ves